MSDNVERVTAVPKKTVKLADGQEYPVSKMTLRDAKIIIPALKKLDTLRSSGDVTVELLEQMQEISFQILVRDNPTMTKEQVEVLTEIDTVYLLVALATGVA